MDTSTLVWIVIAMVSAILVVAALVFASPRTLAKRHRGEAERATQAAEREALSDEAAADARGVQTQAKAAIVARLRRGAATRRKEALAARAEVNNEREPTNGRQSA